MRLLFTTLVAALMVGMVILTVRIWGFGQTFVEFHHPFLEGSAPLLIVKADTKEAIQDLEKSGLPLIIWVDTRTSSDGVLFSLPPNKEYTFIKARVEKQKETPSEKILLGNKISDYPWKDISAFFPKAPLVADLYKEFPKQRFLLNVIDNVMNIDQIVVNTLKPLNPDERTFIQSDTLVVMTSIKDLKPEWVYGTAQADLMRFLSFNSMWILSSTQYKGDVFIAPFRILNRPAFNQDVLTEMRRRHKKIFLGPIQTKEEFEEAKNDHADGYITENLSDLKKWLDQSQMH